MMTKVSDKLVESLEVVLDRKLKRRNPGPKISKVSPE